MKKKFIHTPLEQGECSGCHKPHAAEEKPLLAQPLQPLCGECHEPDSASFNKAHISINAADINCVNCHEPHSSKDPKFFKEILHAPFAAKTCDPCHIVEKE